MRPAGLPVHVGGCSVSVLLAPQKQSGSVVHCRQHCMVVIPASCCGWPGVGAEGEGGHGGGEE